MADWGKVMRFVYFWLLVVAAWALMSTVLSLIEYRSPRLWWVSIPAILVSLALTWIAVDILVPPTGAPVSQDDVRVYERHLGELTLVNGVDTSTTYVIYHSDGSIEMRKGEKLVFLTDTEGRVLHFDSELRVMR